MIYLSDIQFVIVLYKCKLLDSPSFISLSTALEKNAFLLKTDLYVYDNSPHVQEIIRDSNLWNIKYESDPENGGLSKAYNQAAQNAKTLGKKYLILLDQDTTFPEHAIGAYLEAINANLDIRLFAPIMIIQDGRVMSPCIYINKWGKLADYIAPGTKSLDKYVPVNSGLCISLDSFFLAGGYNEKVKLDGADFQFLERFKSKISKEFYVLDLQIHQEFSLFETDINVILPRFKMFLNDVNQFERVHLLDIYYYHRIAFIRTLKLLIQTKSPKVLQYYISFLSKSK